MILHINGTEQDVAASPDTPLLGVLRDTLDLTGSKYGCGEGACGACTVLVNSKAIRSCITPLSELSGKRVITIEGLQQNGVLHPVQQAFLETDPFQCSYCAPGMIMSAVALLEANPSPSDEDIISKMNGNVCRCGTYLNILTAIKLAIKS